MSDFFGIFFSIWQAIGSGAILLFGGSCMLLIYAVQLIVAFVGIIFVIASLCALWEFSCYCLSKLLPKGSDNQQWFENKYLDMKYPSRVRRRRNK